METRFAPHPAPAADTPGASPAPWLRHGAALLLSLLLAAPWAASQADDYPFRLETVEHGDGHEINAINNGPAPVSLRIEMEGSNTTSNDEWPVKTVVPSYTTLTVAEVQRDNPHKPYRLQHRHSWIPGDYSARPDEDFPYRLPYADGRRFLISQADDGPLTTHQGEDDKFAIDFTMPEGEPVLAAREGIVIAVQDGFTVGGTDPSLLDKANAVRVLHPDGTIGHYAHLEMGSIAVRAGEPVLAGQEIGRSGNTGYSSGPHLHFAVTEVVLGEDETFRARTVPVTFGVFKPQQSLVPRTGQWALAEYNKPAPPGWDGDKGGDSKPVTASQPLPATGSAPLPPGWQWLEEVPGLLPLLRESGTRPWWIIAATVLGTWLAVRLLLGSGRRRSRR